MPKFCLDICVHQSERVHVEGWLRLDRIQLEGDVLDDEEVGVDDVTI